MSYARKSTNPVIRASDSWSILNDRYQKNRTGADDPFPPSRKDLQVSVPGPVRSEPCSYTQLAKAYSSTVQLCGVSSLLVDTIIPSAPMPLKMGWPGAYSACAAKNLGSSV